MDMGQESEVAEVGQPPDEAGEPSGGAVTICLTIEAGRVTVEQYAPGGQPTGQGKEMPIGDAMKAVLDAYEQSEGEDPFAQGLKQGSNRPNEGRPTTTGMQMGG